MRLFTNKGFFRNPKDQELPRITKKTKVYLKLGKRMHGFAKRNWITYKAQKAESQLVISIVTSSSRTIQLCSSLAPYLEYMIQMQH